VFAKAHHGFVLSPSQPVDYDVIWMCHVAVGNADVVKYDIWITASLLTFLDLFMSMHALFCLFSHSFHQEHHFISCSTPESMI